MNLKKILHRKKPEIQIVPIPSSKNLPPPPPGAKRMIGVSLRFGSYHVDVSCDNEEILKQVIEALHNTDIKWTEEVKLHVGEE